MVLLCNYNYSYSLFIFIIIYFRSFIILTAGNSASLPDVSGSSLTLNNFKVPEVKVIEEENEEVGEGESKAPIISGISPNFGPFQGGTRITIRGENLGKCRQDIIGLFVCGSNVLASLEYFSSSKIACSTKPWRPGEGTISLETQSGGKCKSTIKFTFEGEITINVCDSDSDAVKRSESLKDNRGDWRVQKSGTPQMPRTNLLERGPLGSKHLGISGITASKSMLDLSVPEGGNSGTSEWEFLMFFDASFPLFVIPPSWYYFVSLLFSCLANKFCQLCSYLKNRSFVMFLTRTKCT